MLKMLIGLLRYKRANKKLYDKNLSTYPEGMATLYNTLDFLGEQKDLIWGMFLMFITDF